MPGPRLLDPPNPAGGRLAAALERLAPELRDRFVAALLLDLRPEEALGLFRLSALVGDWPRLAAELEQWGEEAEERLGLWEWVVASVEEIFPGYLAGARLLETLGRGPVRNEGTAEALSPEDGARGRRLLALWRSPEAEAFRALDRSGSEASLRAALRAARAEDDRFSVLELAYGISRLADGRGGLERGLPLAERVELEEAAERFSVDLLDLCVAECAEAETGLGDD